MNPLFGKRPYGSLPPIRVDARLRVRVKRRQLVAGVCCVRSLAVRAPGFIGIIAGVALFCSLTWAQEAQVDTTGQPPVDLLELGGIKDLLKIPIAQVYGASKIEQEESQAPASVTVIKADEVQKYGYRTLSELLQSVRSLYVTYDRNYAFLGVRGFNSDNDNSRVLVLVDGHRINDNLNDGAAIGTDFILDMDLVQQVEVIRGAGSVLYGNNAFLGVINVVTKRPVPGDDIGGELSTEIGGFDTYKGRITYSKKFKNDLEVLLSGSWYDSVGQQDLYYKQYDTPTSNSGVVHKGDSDAYQSVFGSIRYHDFTLQGGFITREKGNPTAPDYPPGTAFNDPRTRAVKDRAYVEQRFDHKFGQDSELKAKIYYDRASLDRDYLYDFPPVVLNREERVGEWWGSEVQFNQRVWDKHMLTLGGEYRDDFNQQRVNFDDAPRVVYATVHRSQQSAGGFFQGDFELLSKLHLNAGVRYDKYGDFEGTANPRVALIYHPWTNSTFKAIYGTAFRAPNYIELIDPRYQDLEPEKIATYELAYEQKFGAHWSGSLSGFFNQIDDLITLVPLTGYRNLKGAEAKGFEAELKTFWSSGWSGRASYIFQETKDRSTGERLLDSPEQMLKVNLSVPVYQDKIFGNLEFQYVTERTTWAGTEAAGFGVVNATLLAVNLLKGLEASVSLYNLLDERYSDPATPGHLQDTLERQGRDFRVKLTYRF